MIIRNFYDDSLAQASYMVGCAATREAIVIDPLRDIRQYVAKAERLGLRIVAVTETHIHADFLSGSRELASKTGATIYLSNEGDESWKYAYASDSNVVLLKDGDVIEVGNLTLRAIHTPGHTPEHMVFVLTDQPASEQPHSLFTGDLVFVGDVGRPDLLERVADFKGTMEVGARTLFQSLKKLNGFDSSLLLWPGHGAGSACGKSLGGSPVSSLGYERITNWAFSITNEDVFVDEVLSGQPEPPRYFKTMKALNKQGPAILGHLPMPAPLERPMGRVLDIRPADEIRETFISGSLAIPAGPSFTTWAGWLLDYDQPVTLVCNSQSEADSAARDLATIGLDVVAGWIQPDSEGSLLPQTICSDIPSDAFILDVRGLREYKVEHLKSSVHIPLGELAARTSELPRDERIFVHCAAGLRSLMAASLLRGQGFTDVVEIEGGISKVAQRCPGKITVP